MGTCFSTTQQPSTAIVTRINELEKEVKVLKARLDQMEGGSTVTFSAQIAKDEVPKREFDFFISLNVSTALKYGESLKKFIERRYPGIRVFICTEMLGGASYREQIVDAIESSHVIVPLINDGWATSGECSDEFDMARRTNLISHKTGKTKAPDARQPVIVPVFDPDCNIFAYKETRLLASTVNFLPLDKSDPDKTWEKVFASIEWIKPKGMPQPAVSISSQASKDEVADWIGNKDNQKQLAMQKGEASNSLLQSGGGTFVLKGQTVNNYDGNTTVTDRCLLTFADGKVTGSVDYHAGTLYNSGDVSPVEGTYDLKTRKSLWNEIYHHGTSTFVYEGTIDEEGIKGTYFWKQKPTATGTFEFKFERWL